LSRHLCVNLQSPYRALRGVAHGDTTFHYEDDSLDSRDVIERISRNRNDISEQPFRNSASIRKT
jgi:hypothetical protein